MMAHFPFVQYLWVGGGGKLNGDASGGDSGLGDNGGLGRDWAGEDYGLGRGSAGDGWLATGSAGDDF